MKRKAQAAWDGDLMNGQGILSTESGTLKNTPYSFKTRFENTVGTNPEELLAAAHAGCFSMSLSSQLATAGLKPEHIETSAVVSIEKLYLGWRILEVIVNSTAKVPGADPYAFKQAVERAKAGCPVSKALSVKVTVNVKMEN